MSKKFNIKEWQEKHLLKENALGDLPSDKLIKMKWNPLKERIAIEGEHQLDIWDVIGDDIDGVLDDVNKLAVKTTDPKWEKALKVIHNQLRKVEDTVGKFARKLGIIELKN